MQVDVLDLAEGGEQFLQVVVGDSRQLALQSPNVQREARVLVGEE